MSTTAGVINVVETVQVSLSVLQTLLGLARYRYPPTCAPTNCSTYDYIVVGAGSAGSVLANRLTEAGHLVLLLEAGGYPALESQWPGTFPLIPYSRYDYNYTSVNDGRTCQNLRNGRFDVTQGKILGGSGEIHHLYHCQGDADLYNGWASTTNDSRWNYTNIIKYFNKSEKLIDKKLLSSPYAAYHGDSGNIKVIKQYQADNKNYLDSYKELGYTIREDLSGESALGFAQPLIHTFGGLRTSGALAYVAPMLNRTNLCMSLDSTVTKILISDGTATGVQMVSSTGALYELYAKHEVLVAAGAINSVKLLQNSGIGPKDLLSKLNIPLQANLPVGEQLVDHPCSIFAYQMEESNATAPSSNPGEFPAPSTIGYVSLNASATTPDVQVISLLFPHDSTALIQLLTRVFGFKDEICDKFYNASNGRSIFLVVVHLSHPLSKGSVSITSSDYTADPVTKSGYFENNKDLVLLAKNIQNFNKIVNTSYFKEVNANLVDVGVCSDFNETTSYEFWECYTLAMSASMRHYSSTCPMGTVLNSDLTVMGIDKLRVVDSSAMPSIPPGEPGTSVFVLAERAAELVLEKLSTGIVQN